MANKGLSIIMRSKRLKDYLKNIEDTELKELHGNMGEEMINIIQDRFDQSIDSYGVKFKPIKPYIYRFGNQSLRRSRGDPPLKAGLGAPPLRNSIEHEENEKQAFIGTPVNYAKYHSSYPDNNQGARKVIPEREFMGLETDEDIGRILGIVEDFISEMLK